MEGRNNPENISSPVNREKRSEVLRRLMLVARNVDGLQSKTIDAYFDPENEQARRELLRDLSAEQYCQLVTGVNGILRGKEKEDWSMDGVGVTAVGGWGAPHIFPRHEDKREILTKSWEAAQRMNTAGRDLEEIGMLLGSILVETHPFSDGNGRTSRLVYLMTKEGISKEKLQAVLGEEGREEFDMALAKIDIDELFDVKHGTANAEVNPNGIHGILPGEKMPYGKLLFPEGVGQKVRDNLIQAGRADDRIFIAAILRFINDYEELAPKNFEKMYGERKVILVQKLLSILLSGQVEELEKTYWEMKKTYTEEMIDLFENPDKPEYRIEKNGNQIRLIDQFKQRIANKEMLIEG